MHILLMFLGFGMLHKDYCKHPFKRLSLFARAQECLFWKTRVGCAQLGLSNRHLHPTKYVPITMEGAVVQSATSKSVSSH